MENNNKFNKVDGYYRIYNGMKVYRCDTINNIIKEAVQMNLDEFEVVEYGTNNAPMVFRKGIDGKIYFAGRNIFTK